jgi:hypothetical protein
MLDDGSGFHRAPAKNNGDLLYQAGMSCARSQAPRLSLYNQIGKFRY